MRVGLDVNYAWIQLAAAMAAAMGELAEENQRTRVIVNSNIVVLSATEPCTVVYAFLGACPPSSWQAAVAAAATAVTAAVAAVAAAHSTHTRLTRLYPPPAAYVSLRTL